jgi:hypothetical protein
VVVRTEDLWLSADNGRYLAEHIPGAQLLELPGVVVDPWVGDTEPVLQAVEAFLATIPSTAAQAALVAQNRERLRLKKASVPSDRRSAAHAWISSVVNPSRPTTNPATKSSSPAL